MIRNHFLCSSLITPSAEFCLCHSGSVVWCSILLLRSCFIKSVLFAFFSLDPLKTSLSCTPKVLQNCRKASPALDLESISHTLAKLFLLDNTCAYLLPSVGVIIPSIVSVYQTTSSLWRVSNLSAFYSLPKGRILYLTNLCVVRFSFSTAWKWLMHHRSIIL